MKRIAHSLNSSFELENVGKVLSRKKSNTEMRNIQQRFMMGSFLTILLFYDLYTQAICGFLKLDYTFIWFIEMFLLVISIAYTLTELLTFVTKSLFPNYVDVTETEKILLGVADNEPGFRKSPSSTPQATPVRNIKFSPSCYNHSTRLSPNHSLSPVMMAAAGGSSVHLDDSVHSFPSFSASFSHGRTPPGTFNDYLNSSTDEGAAVRKRMSPTRYLSPGRDITCITSQTMLDSFLTKEAAKESKELTIQSDMNATNASSFWNVNRTVMDYIPMLRKFKYQVAPRSSQQSSTSSGNGDPDHPSKYPAHELWTKLGASQEDVDMWIENLRYWLAQTVMQRVAKEINSVNRELRNVGSEDTQVGEGSVSTLKNVAFVKSSFVPTLNNIIPFLEVSSNQEYLVKRVAALGNDGCLADFNWDGGASYNGKSWEDHLPTDSAIVMHMLCTYLDTRLPVNPKYPDGKAFSSQHFMAAQEKPTFDQNSDYLKLYQTKVNPPHYKVIIGKDIYDLPKGRNNLFHAILLFLHEIKVKKNGMLGNVSFGKSGINILWIMTHKYR